MALDEFESVPLSASVRRGLRIAQLQGDNDMVWRFSIESRPIGGSPNRRWREARELWPEHDFASIREMHRVRGEEYMRDRTPETSIKEIHDEVPPGSLFAGSVEEMEWMQEQVVGDLAAVKEAGEWGMVTALVGRLQVGQQVMGRIRDMTFQFLCRQERQLMFSATSGDIFGRFRRATYRYLKQVAPEVLDQFNATYRRARDGDTESLSHALTSARRILVAVADLLYPAREPMVIDGKTVHLGPEQFVNRLRQFHKERSDRATSAAVAYAAAHDFAARADSLTKLVSKGVHAHVTKTEVDLAAIHTYLFVGEVLRVAGEE